MADDESVGTLEEESLKRKERLKALKRKHELPEDSVDSSKNENTNSINLPKPKFRSYRPQDENLKQQIIEDTKPGDVESEITSHLEAANSKIVIDDLDISSLAPRKPDWDLKRDLSKKLEILERRTNKAIAELIRERLKSEVKEMDLATSVADDPMESLEVLGEEFEGEEYGRFVCMKKEIPEEEICESLTSSCSEARTTTGNILERMITDPLSRRPPCLGKWPVHPPKSESDLQENIHQFRAARQPTTLSQMCSLRVTSDPNTFRQPAIVGTIGPASSDVGNILELIEAGMNIAAISMSHIDPCSKEEYFRNVIEANNQYKILRDYEVPVAIMMNLKGPEIRTGKIDPAKITEKSKEIFLKQGAIVRLTTDNIFANRCTDKMIYINYPGLIRQAKKGMAVFISGGGIKLTVDLVESSSVVCIVEKEGKLRNNQKVNIPSLPQLLAPISDFDVECLELAAKLDVDVVAVPNTRNENVIKNVKKILGELQEDNNIIVLATISSYEGLENIDDILRQADGIIIKKNDLSFEIAPEKMLIAQKEIIGKCNRLGKPVLCTGQLSSVESMDSISQRIEMSDIGGAIIDGADGIILTGETAIGDHGVHAVAQLSNTIREAEAATMQKPFYCDLVREQIPSIEPSRAIAMAAVETANKIHASAILAVTTSGKTAQMLSWFRPRCPVIAISRVGKTAGQMNLWRAVIPLHFTAPVLPDWFHDIRARFEYGIAYGRDLGIIKSGDLLVLVSGFRKRSGFTNSIRIVFASLEKNGFVDDVPSYYSNAEMHNDV